MFQVVLFENPGRSISIKENNLKFIYFLQYWHTSYSFCLHFQLLWEAEHRVDQWAPARTSHPPDYICPSRHAHTDTGTTDPETPWAQTTIIPTTTTSHEGKCSKTKNSHQKWDCFKGSTLWIKKNCVQVLNVRYDTSRKWFWLKYFIFTSHKNFYVLSIFCRLASHVINKFTEMLRYVLCARQRVVPATLRNQKGSWTSESKKSLPQQFMCTSSSRQVDGVFSRQIGGACGSDWEGASKP